MYNERKKFKMVPRFLTWKIVRMLVLLVKMESSGDREYLGCYGKIVQF